MSTGGLGGFEEDAAESRTTFLIVCHVWWDFSVLQNFHNNSAAAMRASMLSKVVTAGEFLAALVALEGLVVGVERAIVTLEMFLSAEAT
jgi:hypothetical protein